jgi:hypothetical protein
MEGRSLEKYQRVPPSPPAPRIKRTAARSNSLIFQDHFGFEGSSNSIP